MKIIKSLLDYIKKDILFCSVITVVAITSIFIGSLYVRDVKAEYQRIDENNSFKASNSDVEYELDILNNNQTSGQMVYTVATKIQDIIEPNKPNNEENIRILESNVKKIYSEKVARSSNNSKSNNTSVGDIISSKANNLNIVRTEGNVTLTKNVDIAINNDVTEDKVTNSVHKTVPITPITKITTKESITIPIATTMPIATAVNSTDPVTTTLSSTKKSPSIIYDNGSTGGGFLPTPISTSPETTFKPEPIDNEIVVENSEFTYLIGRNLVLKEEFDKKFFIEHGVRVIPGGTNFLAYKDYKDRRYRYIVDSYLYISDMDAQKNALKHIDDNHHRFLAMIVKTNSFYQIIYVEDRK